MNQIRNHKKTKTRYGTWNQYPFTLKHNDEKTMRLELSVDNPNAFDIESALMRDENKLIQKNVKSTERAHHGIRILIKHKAVKNDKNLGEVLDVVTGLMQQNGFVPVCSVSGAQGNLAFYRVDTNIFPATAESFETVTREGENEKKPDNVAMGILGALGGIALGAVAWILVGMMGYVSAWIAILIVILGFGGYEKFGGKITKPKAIIIFLVALLFIPLAHFITLSIQAYQEVGAAYGFSFFETAQIIGEGISTDTESLWMYLEDVIFGLIFAIIGGIIQVVSIMKTANLVGTSERLSEI